MKINLTARICLALSVSMVAMAEAQVSLDRQFLTVPQQCALHMSEEPVIKKLDLNAAQTKVYEAAVKSYLAESKKLVASKDAKESDVIACDKKFADACYGVLNPAQKLTILRIGIPRIGSLALVDPAIAAKVGLSSSQVTKIKSICQDFAKRDEDVSAMIAKAIEEVPEPKTEKERPAYDKRCAKVVDMYNGEKQRIAKERSESDKKVLEVLTPAQQTKWMELFGTAAKK